eukprot:TRINITY_DN11401_c0_g1_i1.p1 TRINITY_DN11401_c0_g1~~TRINITY_DN11401_c0_g1_i1.p1  ORF type:complete len:278 (+),score=84.21 TRINITY_DN11401_c0_g1_i1:605-1438(+)
MSRRFDSKTNTFNAEGRLMQVEYAVEAINKSRPGVGVLTKEGIVLAAEKDVVSALLEQSRHSEKIYCLDKHIYSVVSGVTADANYLIDYARQTSQRYRFVMRENIPVENLIVEICDQKQYYTQWGGSRLFGAAFIFAGWDKNYGFQLYSSDPSGNYSGWKATAIGTNSLAANSFLKQEYQESMNIDQGLDLAIKALSKTMDTSSPSAEKIEIVVITKNQDGQIGSRPLAEKDILELLKRNNLNVEKKPEQGQVCIIYTWFAVSSKFKLLKFANMFPS